MEFEFIIEIIIKILVGVLATVILALIPKVNAWLKEKLGQENLNKVTEYIQIFCKAAEQQLKDVDPDGLKRKAFVMAQLKSMNIDISEEILDSLIESCVYGINLANKAK